MGINIYPAPTQDVSINTSGNTVKVANNSGVITTANSLDVKLTNVPTVKIDNLANLYKSLKGFSNNVTGQSLLTTSTSSFLVIHSITISQNCTTNNPVDGDRLGVIVFANTTSTLADAKIIASNYEFDGTHNYVFANGGLKMIAGDDLWVCADQYNANGIGYNFTVSVCYTEVLV